MNTLKVGFSRVNITPRLGIAISGYFVTRYAKGVLDELEANCVAFEQDGKRALMIACDLIGINQEYIEEYKAGITKATGVAGDMIYIHATHTHTGPFVTKKEDVHKKAELAIASNGDIEQEYYDFLASRLTDACVLALSDLKSAKMGYGVGEAPNIAFVRRFRMKDGSLRTNPGVDNPDIVAPAGDVDERVNVLRFDREGGDSIITVNFGDHPDVVGGELISGDWPALTRKTVEKTLDNTKCVVFNACQGDVNHVNVHPRGGYLNGMFMDFDDVARGYAHSQYMARVITGGVLQAYDKVKYCEDVKLRGYQKKIELPSNMPTAEELPEAKRIHELHLAGKDSELGYEGMMLTTVVAEAGRMVRLANGPEAFDMTVSGLAIGPVAFVGFPGEPFTGIGRGVKDNPNFELVMHTCLTNGNEGYFPMEDAYKEGGYEARSSKFRAGVAERLVAEGNDVLEAMK